MIRPATTADVPALLELIQELAEYEREPDAVEATEASLQHVLFGPAPAVFALVAEHEGTVVGCAVWFVSFSTWTGRHGLYLEDLVVREAFRGHGYGRQLLTELARISVANGYARLEWSVLDWNEPALAFYRSLGAVAMDGWTVHRVTGDALLALAQKPATDLG
jgi:GNAT superfamily N-acetyltransferase